MPGHSMEVSDPENDQVPSSPSPQPRSVDQNPQLGRESPDQSSEDGTHQDDLDDGRATPPTNLHPPPVQGTPANGTGGPPAKRQKGPTTGVVTLFGTEQYRDSEADAQKRAQKTHEENPHPPKSQPRSKPPPPQASLDYDDP
ncbi:hypothetical protein V5O48_018484, partial [Marasmius crinis-equi]